MVAPVEPEPELWPSGLRAVATGTTFRVSSSSQRRCKRLHPPIHSAQSAQAAQDPFFPTSLPGAAAQAELPCGAAEFVAGTRADVCRPAEPRGTAYVLGVAQPCIRPIMLPSGSARTATVRPPPTFVGFCLTVAPAATRDSTLASMSSTGQ